MTYKIKENIKPKDLIGISRKQIDDHWKLYEGYVSQVNKLNEELKEQQKNGTSNSLTYADRRRRYGFEYNGMVLHEYYFENLKAETTISKEGKFYDALEKEFFSFENWQKDFASTGKTRGIGWAILYADPKTGNLTNNFISEHENGHIAGFSPLLVMDVWEHAYMVDHKAGERGKYIEAFMSNINWEVVVKRLQGI